MPGPSIETIRRQLDRLGGGQPQPEPTAPGRVPPGIPRREQPAAQPAAPPTTPTRGPAPTAGVGRPRPVAEPKMPKFYAVRPQQVYTEDIPITYLPGREPAAPQMPSLRERYAPEVPKAAAAPAIKREAYVESPDTAWFKEQTEGKYKKAAEAVKQAGAADYEPIKGPLSLARNIGRLPVIGKGLTAVFGYGMATLGAPAEAVEIAAGNLLNQKEKRAWNIKTPEDERIWQASQSLTYSGAQRRRMFMEDAAALRAEQGFEPTIEQFDFLRAKHSDFVSELALNMVLDPLNLVGVGSKAANAGRRIDEAASLVSKVDLRPIDDIVQEASRATTRLGGVALEETPKGKLVSMLNPRTGQAWRNRFAEDSNQVVSIVTGTAGKRIEGNLIRSGLEKGTDAYNQAFTLRMGDTVNAVAREWARLASPNADEVVDAARKLADAGFGAVPSSTTGRRTAYVLRKIMEKKDGSLGYLTDTLKMAKEKGLTAEEVVEAWTTKAASVLEDWIPDARWEGKGLHGMAQGVVKARQPLDRVFSTLYMGINPGYAMRNVLSDTALMVTNGWSPLVVGPTTAQMAEEFGYPVIAAARGMGKVGRAAGRGPAEIGHRMAEWFEKFSSRRIVAQAQKQAIGTLWRKTVRDIADNLPEGVDPALADVIRRRASGMGMQSIDEITVLENDIISHLGGPPTVPGQPPVPGGPPSPIEMWRVPSEEVSERIRSVGDALDVAVAEARTQAADYDDYVKRLRDLQRMYGAHAKQAADVSAGAGHTGGSVSAEALNQLSQSERIIPKDLDELAEHLGRMEDEIRKSRARAFASIFTSSQEGEWVKYLDDVEANYQRVLNEVRREQVVLWGQLEDGAITFDEYSDFVFSAYADARHMLDRQYAKVIGEPGGIAYLPAEAPNEVGLLRQDLLRAAYEAGYPSALEKGGVSDVLDPGMFHSLFGEVPETMPHPHFINKINTWLEGERIRTISELSPDELNFVANKFREISKKAPKTIEDVLEAPARAHAAGLELGKALPPGWKAPIPVPEEAKKELILKLDEALRANYWVDDAGNKVWGTFDEMLAADVPENLASVDIKLTPDGYRFTRTNTHGGGDEILRGEIVRGQLELVPVSTDPQEVARYARGLIDSGVPADTIVLEQRMIDGELKWTETFLDDVAERGALTPTFAGRSLAENEAIRDMGVTREGYDSVYSVKAAVSPTGVVTRRSDGLPLVQHQESGLPPYAYVSVNMQGNRQTGTLTIIATFDEAAPDDVVEAGASFVAKLVNDNPNAVLEAYEAAGVGKIGPRQQYFSRRVAELLKEPAPQGRVIRAAEFNIEDFRARRLAARERRLARAKPKAKAKPIPLDRELVDREMTRIVNPSHREALQRVLSGEEAWPNQTNVVYVDPRGSVSYAYMPDREGFIIYDDWRNWLDNDLKQLAASENLVARQAAQAARMIADGDVLPVLPDPSFATAARVGGEDAVRAVEDLIKEADQLRRVPAPPPPEVPLPPEEWTRFFNWMRSRYTETHAVAADASRRARDWALLDYRDRRAFDAGFQAIFPWGYWHSRALPNWAMSIARNPAIMSQYARYKRLLREHNEQDPTIPEWARGQIVLHPPGVEGAFYLDLEATLNPLGNWFDVFEDEDQQRDALGQAAAALGRFGPAPHPLIMMAYAAERGFIQGDDQAARSLGYLAPVTRTFAALTGKVLEPWLWVRDLQTGEKVPLYGGSKWELAKAGRLLGMMQGWGDVEPDEAVLGATVRTTPEFKEALMQAFALRKPTVLASSIFGLRLVHRAGWEQELTLRGMEYGDLKATIGKDAPREFLKKYPEMGTVWMAYDNDRERTASLAWDVLDRIPPGMYKDEVLENAGVNPAMIDAFYESKGDLSGWTPYDVETFTHSIISLARVLRSPERKLAEEWAEARAIRSAMFDEAEELYPGIQEVQERYFVIRDTQGEEAANQYANTTGLFDYWNWSNLRIVQEPLLLKYYADPQDVERAAKTLRSQAAEAQWPGIYQVQDAYYDLPANTERQQYLEANPQLEDYWEWNRGVKAQAEAKWPGIAQIQDGYFDAGPKGSQARKDYLKSYPQLKSYWDWKDGINSVRDTKWPGIVQIQEMYYALPEDTSRKEYLKQHPELKAYWEWKESALETIQAGLEEFSEAAGTGGDIRYQRPENMSLMERQVYESLGGQK